MVSSPAAGRGASASAPPAAYAGDVTAESAPAAASGATPVDPFDPAPDYRDAEARLLSLTGLTRTADRMVTVPATGQQLHVIEIANGTSGDHSDDRDRLPVVLLHGMAAVTAAAIPLVPAFGGRRVIAPDWPGHGLSDAGTIPEFGLRDVPVPLLDAVFADAGVERAHLVGHSMGAQFALYYALERPERVASVTILGAPGVALPGTKAPFSMRLMGVPGLAKMFTSPVSRARYGRNSAMTLGKGTVDVWPAELVDVGWLASLREEFRQTAPRYYRQLARPELTLTASELSQITVPVHALWGDTDVFLGPDAGRAGLSTVPELTFTEVRGGHAPWLNSPRESAEAVRAFLAPLP